MRIGIYGGTYNPPHLGHLTAAKAAIEQLLLDKLLLIPAAVPPHKEIPAGSPSSKQRLRMTELNFADIWQQVSVSDMELCREGKSYTSDTLRELKEQYPNDELYLLMGTDMFLSLESWHEPETVMALSHLGVFAREYGDDLTAQKAHLEEKYGAHIIIVENPDVVEISSTEIREHITEHKDKLTDTVWGYIQREHLYGTNCNLKHLTPQQLRPIALSYLKPKRMPHVLGTAEEAAKLAGMFGVDETEARVAGLLHDCTKKLDMDAQMTLCRKYGIELDELERKALKLLHAKTGAAIAKNEFGVSEDVYQAILWHTTGRAGMSKLEKILYLADYIEPSREFAGDPEVVRLREAVYRDLDRGMLLGLNMTIDEMTGMGNPVHHDTLDARNYLLDKGVTL